MFTLLVCSDVCGVKINLEFQFEGPGAPSFETLVQRVDGTFYNEVSLLQSEGGLSGAGAELLQETSAPPGVQHDGRYHDSGLLSLSRMQIYDDDGLRWRDLARDEALHEFDQLYVFPRSRRHLSSEKDLPPPRAPRPLQQQPQQRPLHPQEQHRHASVGRSSGNHQSAPPQQRPDISHQRGSQHHHQPQHQSAGRGVQSDRNRDAPANNTAPSSSLDWEGRVRFVFAEVDRDAKGIITWSDWQAVFDRTAIRFSEATLDELFRLYGAPPEGYAQASNGRAPPLVVQYSDFANFAEAYPSTFAALFARLNDRQREESLQAAIVSAKDRTVARRRREEELRAELDALKAQADEDARLLRAAEADVDKVRQRRESTEPDEQALLEKEVRVRYHREQLLREEEELAEAARRFETRHSTTGYVSTTPRTGTRRPAHQASSSQQY